MDVKLVLLVAAAVAGCFAQDFGPNSTGTLRTTRQWDCCKPTYAWVSNLAGVAPSPVRSCLHDGETTADPNAQPACHNGGPASACNNQQPFVIDDHAYAFVAGTKINGNPDVGCTCWELTFKEGPVQGKKMTVQVINGGAEDIMENHFDIQIPMSGRGLYPEGCINQWGLEDKVWGGPYGGVNTMEECLKGPAPLHPGCEFRFGSWWQNADNPHADFKRVSCPKVMTDITGCKRFDDESTTSGGSNACNKAGAMLLTTALWTYFVTLIS